MAKQPLQREKVENPFSMGQTPGFVPGTTPDLQNRVNKAQYQPKPNVAGALVDSLVAFAGVGADQYVKQIDKKLAKDKVVQTARALALEAPTDDATGVGLQAHALLRIQDEVHKQQTRLNALCDGKELTEEEWKKEAGDSYNAVDKYMLDNYPTYKDMPVLQQVTVNASREMMEQAVSYKNAKSKEREITGRINTATDALINAGTPTALAQLGGAEGLAKHAVTMMKSLQLTPSQVDEVFIGATLNSRSPELIEASKYFTGARRTTLYNRSGQIQALERTLAKEAASKNILVNARQKYAEEQAYLRGEMSDEEMDRRDEASIRNTGKPQWSEAERMSLMQQKDKALAKEQRKLDAIKAWSNGTIGFLDFTDKETQEAGTSYVDETIDSIRQEALKLPAEQQQEYVKQHAYKTVAAVADLSIHNSAPLKSWLNEFHALATTNVPANLDKENKLPSEAQGALLKLDAMSYATREAYLDKLDSNDAKVIRGYIGLRDMLVPEGQALSKAQVMARNPEPPDKNTINKVTEDIIDDTEAWLKPDYTDAQRAYMTQMVRERVALFPLPGSDVNKKIVKDWLDKGWTTIGNTRLLGSRERLASLTGLEPDHLRVAMEGFLLSNSEYVNKALAVQGMTIDDAFPVTDPEKGTMTIYTKWGPLPETTMPLSKLKSVADKYKHKMEQKMSEQFDNVSEVYDFFMEDID